MGYNRGSYRSGNANGCVVFFVAVLATIPFLLWGGTRAIKAIFFETDCSGYLKRASDANTVEMALSELQKAISYAEKSKLTTGSTRIIFNYPSCDVGFWYNNLKASEQELAKVTPQTSQLERTNLLMKLRETLLDQAEKGTSVTLPDGISIYPFNIAFCFWGWISIFLACIAWVAWFLLIAD